MNTSVKWTPLISEHFFQSQIFSYLFNVNWPSVTWTPLIYEQWTLLPVPKCKVLYKWTCHRWTLRSTGNITVKPCSHKSRCIGVIPNGGKNSVEIKSQPIVVVVLTWKVHRRPVWGGWRRGIVARPSREHRVIVVVLSADFAAIGDATW